MSSSDDDNDTLEDAYAIDTGGIAASLLIDNPLLPLAINLSPEQIAQNIAEEVFTLRDSIHLSNSVFQKSLWERYSREAGQTRPVYIDSKTEVSNIAAEHIEFALTGSPAMADGEYRESEGGECCWSNRSEGYVL